MTVSDPGSSALVARWRRRLDLLAASSALVVVAFVQAPGWVSVDTKLDLHVDPGALLGRAATLWDPIAAGGELQNQAYGYLFPMGPFFWVLHAVGIAPWVVERLWWALILLLGFHGMRLVLTRLGVGTPSSRMVAAAAYALAPRMLIGLGAVSSEIWPMALVPWVLVPLVAYRPGTERRAALWSGVAVLGLGAVNATATLSVLLVPAVWILTRRRPWRLLGWWSVAVVLASLWWIGPLVLLGRYSPPFLDWIESASVTTTNASVSEALRGTTQWIAVIGGPFHPIWPAGWTLLTSGLEVVAGLTLVVVALVGVWRLERPYAVFVRVLLVLGVVAVTFGHVGPATPPWAGAMSDLLDGALKPFRNTHKFEPAVRVALAVGIAHAVPILQRWRPRRGFVSPRLVIPMVVALLVVQTYPAVSGDGFVQRGPITGLPSYWESATRWLDEHPDRGRTVLLPGGPANARVWGEPHDEPLQPLAAQPWIVRDAVPLGSAGATRLLNQVEALVATGSGGEELRTALARLGVSRVVLQSDLSEETREQIPPVVVRSAIESTGALSLASFGPAVGGSLDPKVTVNWGLDRPMPALEIFQLPVWPIVPSVLTPLSAVTSVVGGPEGTAALSDGPTVLSTQRVAQLTEGAGLLVTDTRQRREASFGPARDIYGPLLTREQRYSRPRAVHDWWTTGVTEQDAATVQTAAVDLGGSVATASSTLANGGLGQRRDLAASPDRAFDENGDTGWRSVGLTTVGQWVQQTWHTPMDLPTTIDVTVDPRSAADIAAVTVTTDRGSLRTPVSSARLPNGSLPAQFSFPVSVPAGPTQTLRLTVAEVRGLGFGVRVLDIGAGVVPRSQVWTQLPLLPQGRVQAIDLSTTMDGRTPCYRDAQGTLACSPGYARQGEEDLDLRRELTMTQAGTFRTTGTVTGRSPGADRFLAVPGRTVTASSRWLDTAAVSPALAMDGDPRTYWAAAPWDVRPSLTIAWSRPRRVAQIRLLTDASIAGRRPAQVQVRVGAKTYVRSVRGDGTVPFPAARVREITLTSLADSGQRTRNGLDITSMPLVIGEVVIPGLTVAPVSDTATVGVPCGFGPELQVDGRRYKTAVSGSRGDLLAGQPLALRVCSTVHLAEGAHRVRLVASGEFLVRSLHFSAVRDVGSTAHTPAAAEPPVSTTATQWSATQRTLSLSRTVTSPSLLQVRENANTGWVATASGRTLVPVTVDGWSQGWVVPAGTSGTIELRYGPQTWFVGALWLGLVAALLLLGAALVARRNTDRSGTGRSDPREAPVCPPEWSTRPTFGILLGLVAGLALTGWLGLLVAAVTVVLGRGPGARIPGRVRIGLLAVVAAAWVGWSADKPWPPPGTTNRDAVSQLLAVSLLTVVMSWPPRFRERKPPSEAGPARSPRAPNVAPAPPPTAS